ncbi:hypothetical protein QM565_00115 [Geitlerinema splendidum]|nr:hypothetical protein [Geitlerinema splendidum]
MFLEIPPVLQGKHESLLRPVFEWFDDKPLLQNVFDGISKETFSKRSPLKGTFLVFSHSEKKLLGGAYLLNQQFSSIYPRIDPLTRKVLSPHSKFWLGTVFLCAEENGFSKEYEFICKTFYKALYKKLHEFGQRENINYLYMILEPGESLCTEVLGGWPYVHEVALDEASKGLSHHILSLTKSPPRTPILEKPTQNLDWLNLAAYVSKVIPRQPGEGSYCFR